MLPAASKEYQKPLAASCMDEVVDDSAVPIANNPGDGCGGLLYKVLPGTRDVLIIKIPSSHRKEAICYPFTDIPNIKLYIERYSDTTLMALDCCGCLKMGNKGPLTRYDFASGKGAYMYTKNHLSAKVEQAIFINNSKGLQDTIKVEKEVFWLIDVSNVAG